MVWQIKIDDSALADLAKLDKPVARRITSFLRERVAALDDPRSIGEALQGSRFGAFWRYRVGDYRVISDIEDDALRILIVRVRKRSEVYR